MPNDDDPVRRFERLEPLPEDDIDTLPLLAGHEHSSCGRCGARYDEAQFMAQLPPSHGDGTWTYAAVTLAVRQCASPGCGNLLGRRIA